MTHACSDVLVVSTFVQVIVASKFDNRLKEFAERWEVDKYLSASGYLAPNVRPFFVALPKVSIQTHSHWHPCTAEVHSVMHCFALSLS